MKKHSVDDESHITKDLGDIVHDKAFPLEVEFEMSVAKGIFKKRTEDGQVGLLRRGRLQRSPGPRTTHHAVIPVTSKHNLCCRCCDDNGVTKNVAGVYMGLMDTYHESLKLSFQDANWTCKTLDEITLRETTASKVTWEYGLDISFGTKINSSIEGVTNVDYSFEVVRPDFVCTKEMRVGIAVYSTKPKRLQKKVLAETRNARLTYQMMN